MNLWPFRRQPKKPQWTINLHESILADATAAAAWTTYAGTKVLLRTGKYFEMYPEARGHESPFNEESYARDALAEFWAVQAAEKQAVNAYLQLLVRVRNAGFVREYVWRFLRDKSWEEPGGLNL